MKGFLKTLFGGGAEKLEEKADELRLDFEYREAAHFYQRSLESLGKGETEAGERLKRKLREVRRRAVAQLLEEAAELQRDRELEYAHEKLETALNFADDDSARSEVERRIHDLEEIRGFEAPPPVPEETADGADVFDLALAGFDEADRERAIGLGTPFRDAYESCQREDWAEAARRFDALLAEHQDDPLILEYAGLVAERAGDMDRALERFERVQTVAPFRPTTVQSLAKIYWSNQRSADVHRILSEACVQHPATADLDAVWVETHLDHATFMSDNGHHDAAISSLFALLDVRTAEASQVYFTLGGVLQKAGRIEECIAALERAIESAPRRPLYHERLADVLVKHGGDLGVALKLMVSANEVETTSGAGMFGGGASKAITSPNRARYLYKMARIFFLQGEDLEADRTITTALAVCKDPEVTQALEELREEMQAGSEEPSD